MNTAKRLDSTQKSDDALRRETTARVRHSERARESSRPSASVRIEERKDAFYDDVPCTD